MSRHDPIHTVTLADGRKRYRFVIDEGIDPGDGRRRQRTYTLDTKKAAQTKRADIISALANGTHVARTTTTFAEAASTWLASKRRTVREVTLTTYSGLLGHATRAFGMTLVQRLTRRDVEKLADDLTASGLSGRTIGLTLTLTRAVLDMCLDEQMVPRNVATHVQAPEHHPRERAAFTPDEVARLVKAAAEDRLHACWLLSLSGLRRSEVLGLTWPHVDLTNGTVAVVQGRVRVAHDRTVVGDPKTRRGRRVLPMTEDTKAALRFLRAVQRRERLAAGIGAPDPTTDFVAVNEVGEPITPDAYSAAWTDLCQRAGVRPLTLHSARHTSVTTMRDQGVADHIVAAWHGHDEAVMRRVYSHALADPMSAAAEVLAAVRAGSM